MAITQDDYGAQLGRAYPGMAADTSPQINDSKTVADGSTFAYGQIAVASGVGDGFCENFDGSQTYFEGLVARYFRKDQRSLHYNKPGEASALNFTNPDTLDLTIMGAWFVVPSEAITSKGQVAIDEDGNFVNAAEGTWIIQGATYEETGPADEPLMIRLTGGRLISKIEPEAPAP